ncbi:HAD family hydrolase [Spirosoma soli]|uniref:HAD family hydrolase n=1 Tax=Spirosoma soli TaxID=1770529 RepID=A0ABW5MFB4_9BACT
MPIDTIVFDFGGVLIDWNPRYLYRKLIADEQQMEWFLSNVCTDEWNVQQDKGRSFAEATSVLQNQFPDHKDLIAMFYGRWEEMLNGEISESVAILRELKDKHYKLYGLTNWSTESFPIAKERYEFLNLFDGILVSGEEKLIKPDPAIFHLLLKRYNLTPETCVFIDDNLNNVKAASSLGFTAIHFQSGALLRDKLVELNVLADENVA